MFLAAALASPGLASASTLESFGFGPRAEAMSGAVTADSNDFASTYYNPALLVRSSTAHAGLALSWNRPSTDVTPLNSGTTLDCRRCQAPETLGFSGGVVVPLGGKVRNRVALGLGAYLPSQRLVRVRTADPSTPFWYSYDSDPDRVAIYAGAGFRISNAFSLGVGLQILANLVGQGANLRVDLFSKKVIERQIDSSLTGRTAPTAGLAFSPLPSLRFGLNYRWEMALYYQIPAVIDLQGIGVLGFTLEGTTHFSPHTVTAGMAWDVLPQLTLSLDGAWANWSAAPSPYLGVTVDLSGATLKALGLDEAFDLSAAPGKAGFSDTLSGRFGAEFRPSDRVAVRAGVSYRPTPVPKQDVPGTNILDISTVGVSAGVGFAFEDPLELFQNLLKVDIAAQASFAAHREAHKESTDPVVSYRYSAQTLGLSGGLRYDF